MRFDPHDVIDTEPYQVSPLTVLWAKQMLRLPLGGPGIVEMALGMDTEIPDTKLSVAEIEQDDDCLRHIISAHLSIAELARIFHEEAPTGGLAQEEIARLLVSRKEAILYCGAVSRCGSL